MKIGILAFIVLAFPLVLISCDKVDEQDALAKAQRCLDKIPVGQYDEARNCITPIEKYNSQQAHIIKCSSYFIWGGLMENKVLKAYQASKDDTITNKEAAFMSVMSLHHLSLDEGLTKAKAGNTHCQASGVPGLMYLSNVIVAGTAIAKTVEAFGTTIDENTTPAQLQAALNAMLADCTSAAPVKLAACTENLVTIGTAVGTLSVQYCASEKADDDLCKKVKDATQAGGNNATNIGQALLCYMNNKTFDPSTQLCQ